MKSFNQLISEMMTSSGVGVAGMHVGHHPGDNPENISGREPDRLAIRPKRPRRKKKKEDELGEELRRRPIPSWDEIVSKTPKYKRLSDEKKQEQWDRAGLNMHNISHTDPNYVHRNNEKFNPRTGKLEETPLYDLMDKHDDPFTFGKAAAIAVKKNKLKLKHRGAANMRELVALWYKRKQRKSNNKGNDK